MSLEKIRATAKDPKVNQHLEGVLEHLASRHPDLELAIKWGKPMFSQSGAFIIGFDVAKAHLSVIPEPYAMETFADAIEAAGYGRTDNLFKITADQEPHLDLLEAIIAFKREDKVGAVTYFKAD